MDRFFPSFALASCLAVAAPFAAVAQTDAIKPVVVDGRCSYSDGLAPLLEQGHVLVECDRLEMRGHGKQVEIKFAFPARLRFLEFRGTFNEQGWFDISAIRLRSQRDWNEAEGRCEFNPPSSEDRLITCLAKDGPRFFVVNFIPDSQAR